ncbi:hypothetical protein N8644_01675 [bacterium]|nr:hypothetical protein [bacterium]
MMMKCTRRNENPLTVFEDVFGSLFNDSFGTPTKTPKTSEWSPAVVLYESFLSYLGLGIQPPRASLGSLIAEGAAQINPIRVYWWMIVYPAGSLAALLMALNFLGDGLRDVFDPKVDKDR